MAFPPGFLERLAGRAARLPGRDPRAHVFAEDRLERRLEADAGGARSGVGARVRGLAVDAPPGPAGYDSASDAGWGPAAWAIPGEVVAEALAALAARAAAAAGPGSRARATWVEVDQAVAVAFRDGRAARDRRRGARVAVEVRGEGRGSVGRAEADAPVPEAGPRALEGLAEWVGERARTRASVRRPPAGELWVAFAPGAGGVLLHELVGHALEADLGPTRLSRAPGPVAPEGVTVVDDPRRGRVPWRVDDEGTPSAPVVLVQAGRVTGSLGSLRWPARSGRSTGHGRRASFADPVLPRMGATYLLPGRVGAAEVLAGIERGAYVRRLAAAWCDPFAGTATFRVTDADLVTGGRLDGPLAPFLLRARVEDLATLDRIAADLAFDASLGVCVREGQAMAASVGAPTFRIALTTVGS